MNIMSAEINSISQVQEIVAKRDELAKERAELPTDPFTSQVLDKERRDALSEKIVQLTAQVEIRSL